MTDVIQKAGNFFRCNSFRKYFRKSQDQRAVVWKFQKGSKILSLSPHPDDDAIGWGGWLHKNALYGNSVISVCITDGSAGGGTLYSNKQELVRLRKEETCRAAGILGITKLFFWDQPDAELKPNKALINRLHNLILDYRPDIVVLPSFLDDHPDHQTTSEILAKCLHAYPQRNLLCLQGEIWTPLPYWNSFVSIDSVLEVKKQAIKVFETQMKQANLLAASLALARYRGVFAQHCDQYNECFLVMNAIEYVELWKLMAQRT